MSVLLVDTFSAFFRAHYALPAMTTRAGEPTSALYGFSVLMLKLLREHPGTALAFAVDTPAPSFRQTAYREYKANRAAAPAPLALELRRLPRLLEAFGVPVLGAPGFEADDVLATLAERARSGTGTPALVVSGDRDMLQLARGSVRVHFIGRRGMAAVTYDEALVEERFGIPPVRLPTYVALIGDPSDNLPSVPGVGAATARRLCTTFADARDLFARLSEVTPDRLQNLLSNYESQVVLCEELARLRTDVPLAGDEPPWKIPSRESLEKVRSEFEALEFKSLVARLEALVQNTAS
jgi:DNA polymerase-1